jgi:hypothetical protein
MFDGYRTSNNISLKKLVYVLQIYTHIKFCMTNFHNSLIIAIKSKAKYRFHAASILMFHILYITYLTEAVLQQRLHIVL